MIGPCIVTGYECRAKETFAYQLQMLVRKDGYSVIRVSFNNIDLPEKIRICKELPIKEKDIIIFVNTHQYFDEWDNKKIPAELTGYNYIDTLTMYEAVAGKENWYSDAPAHTNGAGNRALARYVYEHGLNKLIKSISAVESNHYLQKGSPIDKMLIDRIDKYISQLKLLISRNKMRSIIGCIVMNCNPFTIGHRYLIENAASQVDELIVFVVEEDRSEFSFKNRFEMVKAGVADVNNVRVVPSGPFIISYETLPIYFEKAQLKHEKVNAALDLDIFARKIAPELGITIRFAGEEPYDAVTKQYNEQMARQLPEFGIMFCEIPRLVQNGEIVSASKVRNYLKKQEWDKANSMLPESTKFYLKNL